MLSMTFQTLRSTFGFAGQAGDSQLNARSLCVLCAAMLCIFVPVDNSQLVFAVLGALAYGGLQLLSPKARKTNCQLTAERDQREHRSARDPRAAAPRPNKGALARPRRNTPPGSPGSPQLGATKPEVYQPSLVPVIAPIFQSTGWDAEVKELISQLMPDIDEDRAVQQLVLHVKRTLQPLFPGVEVTGFAHASLKSGKAFGVAVPEVDIVANVNPIALAQLLQRSKAPQHRCPKLLQKSAVRACADKLVSMGGLKFRRSAFRGEEPRVTLLVPTNLGFFPDAVPVDVSVNSVTPFYTAALLTECGQIDPRAKDLMMFVKRWAKDRGICHASKGHLSPYMWNLLVMYFMQVGVEKEGSLLPELKDFAISSGLMNQTPNSKSTSKPANKTAAVEVDHAEKLSVGQLFNEFVHFYSQRFNYRNEAISVRLGQRAAPHVSVPLHLISCGDNLNLDVAPTIEDPFKAGVNLGTCMNAMSLARFREELTRAVHLCGQGASLTALLEPWCPAGDAPAEAEDGAGPAGDRSSGSSPGEDDEQHSKHA